MKKSGRIPRTTRLLSSSRIRPRNDKRAKRLFEEDFGSNEYVEHLHAMPCAVCEVFGWTVAAHTKSRGAGGKVDDLAPLCGSRFLGTPIAVIGCHELLDGGKLSPETKDALCVLAKKLWREWNIMNVTEPTS